MATTLIMLYICVGYTYFCNQTIYSLYVPSLSVALCHIILSVRKVFFILVALFTNNNNNAMLLSLHVYVSLTGFKLCNCNCNWLRSNNLLTRMTRPFFGCADAKLDSWIIHLNKRTNKSFGCIFNFWIRI